MQLDYTLGYSNKLGYTIFLRHIPIYLHFLCGLSLGHVNVCLALQEVALLNFKRGSRFELFLKEHMGIFLFVLRILNKGLFLNTFMWFFNFLSREPDI